MFTGPQGIPGPTGPKDSIVKTALGIYAFACIEGSRPWFLDTVPAGDPPRTKFKAAVVPTTIMRFRSECGKTDMLIGVRCGMDGWDMPERSAAQMKRASSFWQQAR